MKLLFFDHSPENIAAYKRHLAQFNAKFELNDVQQIVADVFVSPANAYGYMDGGIDEVYMAMFPGVQTAVQNAISQHGLPDAYGRNHLPVGSGLLVPVARAGHCAGSLLLCAPTMTVPQKLAGARTNNVYWAMLAILRCAATLGANSTVAVPCLGTGVGGLSGEDSAAQVARAMRDFYDGTAPTGQVHKEQAGIWVTRANL